MCVCVREREKRGRKKISKEYIREKKKVLGKSVPFKSYLSAPTV